MSNDTSIAAQSLYRFNTGNSRYAYYANSYTYINVLDSL